MAALRITYDDAPLPALLADPAVLAVVEFGTSASVAEPRRIGVDLPLLAGTPLREVWRGVGTVVSGSDGDIRWSSDGDWCQFALAVDESGYGDIAAATRAAYARLAAFLRNQPALHVLRLWNYFDAITAGEGDDERYRRFCVGRDDGLAGLFSDGYPAATAIGGPVERGVLQVYGLAARRAGMAIENPRQVSAWRYPREYGPVAPGFARAMKTAEGPLLISGTAAIVGHRSRFDDDLAGQTDEMLANLRSLLGAAQVAQPAMRGAGLLLKAYLRSPDDVDFVRGRLHEALPELSGLLLLGGVVCRRELVVEIDGVLA